MDSFYLLRNFYDCVTPQSTASPFVTPRRYLSYCSYISSPLQPPIILHSAAFIAFRPRTVIPLILISSHLLPSFSLHNINLRDRIRTINIISPSTETTRTTTIRTEAAPHIIRVIWAEILLLAIAVVLVIPGDFLAGPVDYLWWEC